LCCCVLLYLVNDSKGRPGNNYELGVELGQSRLTVVIEDKDCVDHLAQSSDANL
jgi:hypothetical protein